MAKRIAIGVIILGAMVAVLALYLPHTHVQQPPGTAATAVIGGPFTLSDTTGNVVTEVNLKGRYSLIFFGFTHCPDICPVTLQTVTQALKAAGPAGEKVQPVFITLDPERDTPEALATYMANFDPRFIALTGTPEQVNAITKAFRVYATKTAIRDAEGKDTGDYSVSHSGFMYLLDRDGKYLGLLPGSSTADEIVAYLKNLT